MLGWVGYLTCIFGACTGVVVADFKSLMRITAPRNFRCRWFLFCRTRLS